jgi:hypothetical protein
MPKKMKEMGQARSIGYYCHKCDICGYTCKNYKDLKLQKKMIELHITKNHPIID